MLKRHRLKNTSLAVWYAQLLNSTEQKKRQREYSENRQQLKKSGMRHFEDWIS